MIDVMAKQKQRTKNKLSKAKVHQEQDLLEKYIAIEDRGLVAVFPLTSNGADIGRSLNPMRLAEIRKCPDCRMKPVVFLTKKKIPTCEKHWDKLADAQISWSEN